MINKEKCFVSAVFYLRNYEKYIEKFLVTIISELSNKFEHFELICVNNDSTDKSVEIVNKICKESELNFVLNIVNLSYCRSIEEAMAVGTDFAIGDFIYQFNSVIIDYDTSLIYEGYLKLLDNNDVVFISPDKKYTFEQKLYYSLYNLGVKSDKKLMPERFQIVSRRIINRIDKMSNYYTNNMAVYRSCGLQSLTIHYKPSKFYIKYDKEEKSERIYKAIESLIVYTHTIPYLLLLFAFICFIISIFSFVCFNKILFVLFFSITIFSIICTIIIQYLQTLINLSFKKQIHMIKSIQKVVK